MNQQVIIYNKTSYDGYGREVVGGATTTTARFQRKNKQRLSPTGSVITIEATCYLPPDTTVSIDDKITHAGSDYKVYGIYTAVDGSGSTNHIKADLIKWLEA